MGFNNGRERRKFELEWKRLRVEYAAAGMDGAAIDEMYRYDLMVFNSDRRFYEHSQQMPYQEFADDGDIAGEENSPLQAKFFDSISVMPQDTDSGRRGSWLDEIESERLSAALRRLSPEDIELLTLYAFDGYGVTEIAAMKGVAQPTVSKKLKRIKNFFKKF